MPFRPINRSISVPTRTGAGSSPPPAAAPAVAAACPAEPGARKAPAERSDRSPIILPKDTAKRSKRGDRTGPNWTEDGDYVVGKDRPPVEHQWKPGQSGNPRGPKPKEKLDPQAAFERELLTPFTIRINGEEVTITMGTFSLNLLKKEAAGGSIKASQILLQLYQNALRNRVEADDAPAVEEWERQIIEDLLAERGLPPRPVVRRSRNEGDEV